MSILRSPADLNNAQIRGLYDQFDAPVTDFDCGVKCAGHNNGIPFCCDTAHAVPAVYRREWQFFQGKTDLWHHYQGKERASLLKETPENMTLLACKGHSLCERNYRAFSCRQFPFYPYITKDYRFTGLAYEWDFEHRCWVISHLDQVTPRYRSEFVQFYDWLFSQFDEEFEAYAEKSAQARAYFSTHHRRIALLHRNGNYYLVSPHSERASKVAPSSLPVFAPYHK